MAFVSLTWPNLFLVLGIIACSIGWALILQAITPSTKKRSGHAKLGVYIVQLPIYIMYLFRCTRHSGCIHNYSDYTGS